MRTTEDEMVGWDHQFNARDLEQSLGDGEGQGSLACYSPKGHKELDTTWQLNNSKTCFLLIVPSCGMQFTRQPQRGGSSKGGEPRSLMRNPVRG